MIFTDRTITVRKGESRIDEPIVVYRGDYELEVRFTILNSRFKFMSGTNMIESEKASYGQLAILTPYGGNIFSDIVRCNDGSVTFVLTAEMLNQIEEVGLYSFQIRLMDYNKESRVSIPPIEFGIEVREPIASEDHDNSVNNAIVGYSIAKVVDPKEENVGHTFDEDGNYNKTQWETGDRISQGKLNKIEDAIHEVNKKEINNKNELTRVCDTNFIVLSNELDDKATKEELSLERKRIDVLVKTDNGATDGNSELLDIRIGYDGTEYDIAGDAVREQVNKLSKNIDGVNDRTYKQFTFIDSFIDPNNGKVVTDNGKGRYCTDFILINNKEDIHIFAEFNNVYVAALCYYDENKDFLSSVVRVDDENVEHVIYSYNRPKKANYVRASTKTALLDRSYIKNTSLNNLVTMMSDDLLSKVDEIERNYVKKDKSKNLFDKNKATIDVYLNSKGDILSLANYYVSDYIEVEPDTSYYFGNIGVTAGGGCTIFFNKNKEVISAYQGQALTNPINTPSNCKFLRTTGCDLSTMDTAQIEKGTMSTAYVPYYELKDINDIRNDISCLYTGLDKKLNMELGKNLFDSKSKNIIMERYLTRVGPDGANSLYYVSDYIDVEPNEYYSHSGLELGGAYNHVYDKFDRVILYTRDNPILIPADGVKVRLSGVISNIDKAQFEKGEKPTSYSPYTKMAFIDKSIKVVFPNKIYFVKNKQSCIYYENVLFKDLNDPGTLRFNKGVNTNRLASFNFDAAINNAEMLGDVTSYFNVVGSKNIAYDVIDGNVNSGKTVNMLFIGDSFTDIGSYISETKNLLEENNVNVNLIGTCGNGTTIKAEGLSGGKLTNTFMDSSTGIARIVNVSEVYQLPSTGYPGRIYIDDNGNNWTIRGGKVDSDGNGHLVVTKWGCTESDFSNFPSSGTLRKTSTGYGQDVIKYSNPTKAYFNPFLNHTTGVLDFKNYIDFWGFEVPDIVVFQFTWNDLPANSSEDKIKKFISDLKVSIEHIKNTYSSTKFIISIEPFGSVNALWDWRAKKKTVLELVEFLVEEIELNENYNSWVKIAPSYAFVDLVYGYSNSSITPCERYPEITENSGGDGVHPTTGMLQIADCIYPIVHHFLLDQQ